MRRLILFISVLVGTMSVMAQHGGYQREDYKYEVVEDGIHFVYEIGLYGTYYFDDDNKRVYTFDETDGAALIEMWHEPTSYVPEKVIIPGKIHVSIHKTENTSISTTTYDIENDVNVVVSSMWTALDPKPANYRSFYTVAISKDVNIVNWVVPTEASGYVVEPEGSLGRNFYCDNGMLITGSGYFGEGGPETIAAVPNPFNNIVFRLPERMRNFQYDSGYCDRLNVPLVLNRSLEKISGDPFEEYPFCGLEIPRGVDSRSYRLMKSDYPDVGHSKLVAFENCNLIINPELRAGIIVDDLKDISKSFLFRLYGKYWNLEYVQLNTEILPEFKSQQDDYLGGSQSLEPGDRKVVTYVRPELLDGFKAMQERGDFPENAELKPIEDFVYLYSELDFGKWYGGRCQAVFGECRFGDSEVVKKEWSSDRPEVATVDENGVVTAVSEGKAKITLTITDNKGEEKRASSMITASKEDVSSVVEIGDGEGTERPVRRGVYNLHGIYLGESEEGLPAGLYIVDGKKKIVKI